MNPTGFTGASGRTEFLTLFVAQLQNQDPLEPVDQQEVLGQLAQFSTVEGIEQLNSGQQDFNAQFSELLDLQLLSSGASLLGKSVSFGNGSQSGIATEVQQDAGQVLVRVGDHLVPVANIESVSESHEEQTIAL